MPKLTVGGTEILGVREAHVRIVHGNPKAPDPVPMMEWDVLLRLQHEDFLPKWALAKQSADRWKRCELVVNHSNGQVAHKWTLLNAYVHNFEEVEHPGDTGPLSGEGGYYVHLVIQGSMPENVDYSGENVMQIAAGEARTDAS